MLPQCWSTVCYADPAVGQHWFNGTCLLECHPNILALVPIHILLSGPIVLLIVSYQAGICWINAQLAATECPS